MPGQFLPQLPQLAADRPVVHRGANARYYAAEQLRIDVKTQAHSLPGQLCKLRFQSRTQGCWERRRRRYFRANKAHALVQLQLEGFTNIAEDADTAVIDNHVN